MFLASLKTAKTSLSVNTVTFLSVSKSGKKVEARLSPCFGSEQKEARLR